MNLIDGIWNDLIFIGIFIIMLLLAHGIIKLNPEKQPKLYEFIKTRKKLVIIISYIGISTILLSLILYYFGI
jgi:hypothetical protein